MDLMRRISADTDKDREGEEKEKEKEKEKEAGCCSTTFGSQPPQVGISVRAGTSG